MNERATFKQAVYAAPHLEADEFVVMLDGELIAHGKIHELDLMEMRESFSTPGVEIHLHPDVAAEFQQWLREQARDAACMMRLH